MPRGWVVKPLAVYRMPLLRCRETAGSARRWSSSKVPWVRPETAMDVTYFTWTVNNLPRQASHQRQHAKPRLYAGVEPFNNPQKVWHGCNARRSTSTVRRHGFLTHLGPSWFFPGTTPLHIPPPNTRGAGC